MNDHDADLRALLTTDAESGVTVTTTSVSIYPARLNLRIPQGRDWSLYVTWMHKDSQVDTSSGYTAELTARTVQGGTALMSLTNGSGITLGASFITINRTAAQTAALSFVRCWYNLNLILSSVKTPLLEGFIDLDKSVLV
ncbi:MAG: hypothetical protein AB7I42_22980 [Bradyrhizobium sp.]|uniref:hypothetical protein n=1 Tax=Bradyrhizobium sp. TaxID=376 RepID=UPI003D0D3461